MSEAANVLVLPVLFADLDALGHVNHARHLTYCEQYRVRLLQQLDAVCPDEDPWMGSYVVVAIKAHYRRPVTLADEQVQVTGEITDIGTSSVRIRNLVYAAAQGPCVEVVVNLVRVGRDGRPRPMSEEQRRWWGGLQASKT